MVPTSSGKLLSCKTLRHLIHVRDDGGKPWKESERNQIAEDKGDSPHRGPCSNQLSRSRNCSTPGSGVGEGVSLLVKWGWGRVRGEGRPDGCTALLRGQTALPAMLQHKSKGHFMWALFYHSENWEQKDWRGVSVVRALPAMPSNPSSIFGT